MKFKGIILAVIISLASIMMPFNVHADSFDWYRVTGELMSSQLNNELTINNTRVFEYLFNYQYHVKFDDSYLGYAQISITQEYYDDTDNNGAISIDTLKTYTTPSKTYYVNSDEVVINLSLKVRISSGHIQTNYDPCKNFTPSVSISNANVTKIGLLTSIDQVIDILSDIYSSVDDIEGLSTNQLTELENIVSNTSLANDYLDILTQIRQYHIEIESYPYVIQFFKQNISLLDNTYLNESYLNYPVFNLNNTTLFNGSMSSSNSFVIIFGINKLFNIYSVSQFLDIKYSGQSVNTNQFSVYRYSQNSNPYFNFYKLYFNPLGTAVLNIKNINQAYFIPVFAGLDLKNFSNDFALRWGLSNSLLDNIQIIANGTAQSNSAASDLETSNDQMADDMDDLATIENGYNQQFNNQLQSIDFSSPIQNNAGILPAANFVITIFNGLINNNPFSVLIIIVCILLIGKKVIGK